MSILKGALNDLVYVWPTEQPQHSLLVIDAVTMMIHETSEILAKKLRKPFPAVKKLIEELNGLGPESQEMPVKFGEKHGPEGYLPIKTVRSGEEGR